MGDYIVQPLPLQKDIESKKVLKRAAAAHRFLAELKGVANSIPNQAILINTLFIQEAKDSSEIENIVTTHDELFKTDIAQMAAISPATKEVKNYISALKRGFELIQKKGLLTVNNILEVQQVLECNQAGLRKLPGTTLKNLESGDVIYTPPQNAQTIIELMVNLEKYINDDSLSEFDPLIKMAIVHFQFESIHPFYDGNGRTGRIINILYLLLKNLLSIPVLYLSRYIINNKKKYYELLQKVRTHNSWEEWIIFILEGIKNTAQHTIAIINEIKNTMQDYKTRIRSEYKFYSHDLLNNLFSHPYTKIEFLQDELKITRATAAKYLEELTMGGFLQKEKIGRNNYFINKALFKIFTTM